MKQFEVKLTVKVEFEAEDRDKAASLIQKKLVEGLNDEARTLILDNEVDVSVWVESREEIVTTRESF